MTAEQVTVDDVISYLRRNALRKMTHGRKFSCTVTIAGEKIERVGLTQKMADRAVAEHLYADPFHGPAIRSLVTSEPTWKRL